MLDAFGSAQRNAEWMIKLNDVSHAHEQFLHLQSIISGQPTTKRLYN